jgi:hypothetical protein
LQAHPRQKSLPPSSEIAIERETSRRMGSSWRNTKNRRESNGQYFSLTSLFLGVQISGKLDWQQHCNCLVSKLSSAAFSCN